VTWILVAAGGAAGSLCRWLLASAVQSAARTGFPAGTLAVNVLGSLAAGWLAARLTGDATHPARLLLLTGFCGGFTTFSAFTLETAQLVAGGRAGRALLYVAVSLALGLVAVAAGWALGRRG
jgi:CrcB protein